MECDSEILSTSRAATLMDQTLAMLGSDNGTETNQNYMSRHTLHRKLSIVTDTQPSNEKKQSPAVYKEIEWTKQKEQLNYEQPTGKCHELAV